MSPSDDAPATSPRRRGLLRALGLGIITGAADDDPSAIGTFAAAGARFGPSFLWVAPAVFPMMFAVVYLSAKLGQVSGRGLFQAIRYRYPRWVLWLALFGVLMGNTIEAAADIGGIAAAVRLLVDVPEAVTVVLTGATVLAAQVFLPYTTIRAIFRWLALALLAYVGAAVLAKPDPLVVLRGTFVPTIEWSAEFLSMIVAIIGTTLSAYLYTWQSNQEVEEEIALGRVHLHQRRGATQEELRRSRRDVLVGMLFSNVIMYFVILSTGATLYEAGQHEVSSAAQAAEALRPIAGDAAGLLFAGGMIGVGFLAVPVMTVGAAYDVAQAFGWKHSLHGNWRDARGFYLAMVGFTLIAIAMNFLGINPMKALVWAAIVQGFSTPPLMFLILRMTNDPELMGDQVNSRWVNVLGWTTTVVISAASLALIGTWILG